MPEKGLKIPNKDDMTDFDDKFNIGDENQAIWDAYTKDIRDSDGNDEDEQENFQELLDSSNITEDQSTPEVEVIKLPNKRTYVESNPLGSDNRLSEPQLDRRTEEKLRKGKMPIEARIDLHGMSKSQAHDSLSKFIVECYEENLRCVLVITGKGKSKSTGDNWLSPSKGILKENVPYWLMAAPLKNIVLKFFNAKPKDGGGGALYVYIKKKGKFI